MLKSLVYILINPIFWLFVFGMAFLIFRSKKNAKGRRIASILFWMWLFLIYVSPLPQYLIYHLEYKYPIYEAQENHDTTHILVLGGGVSQDVDFPANARLSSAALARLVEGIRIYHKSENQKLVLSGYSASDRETVAEIMGEAALILKVSPNDTLLNVHPGNTEEEALFYKKRFGDKAKIILVTSAFHMPRAMIHFENMGLNPIPAPTDYRIHLDDIKSPFHFKPSIEKLQMMQIVMKEFAALLYLKLFT